MPPWIFAIELGVVAFYIVATLDARFAIDYGDSLYADVVCAKERTLTSESLVFYLFIFFYTLLYICYYLSGKKSFPFRLQSYKNNAKM